MKSICETNMNNGATRVVNLRVDKGVVEHVTATRNAVIVDYVQSFDYDGEPYLNPIITIECKDMDMLPELEERASMIFNANVAFNKD